MQIRKRGKMAKIKRIGVLKFALFSTLWAVIFGLIEGIIFSLISLATPFQYTAGNMQFQMPFILDMFFSSFAFITFPLFLAVIVFPASLIMALIINLILKIIKGFQLTIDFSEERQS